MTITKGSAPSTPTDQQSKISWLQQQEEALCERLGEAERAGASALQLFRTALDGAVPLLGASFASIYLQDAQDPALLQLTCARRWPQSSARFLAKLRIRLGRGATGLAVAECRVVEVDDVFSDASLREWWEPARELGFAAATALPLRDGTRTGGALTLYFAEPRRLDEAERQFLTRLADLLSKAAARGNAAGAADTASV